MVLYLLCIHMPYSNPGSFANDESKANMILL